jgi:hypothetical protein
MADLVEKLARIPALELVDPKPIKVQRILPASRLPHA